MRINILAQGNKKMNSIQLPKDSDGNVLENGEYFWNDIVFDVKVNYDEKYVEIGDAEFNFSECPILKKYKKEQIKKSTQRAQSIVGTSPGRPDKDFYPTPPEATKALLRMETFGGTIWEPACGDGAISKILEVRGYTVKSSDLVNRGYGESPVDFLSCQKLEKVQSIITNPPYCLAEQFVKTALSVTTDKVAMLLKLVFLEGISRKPLFETTPLARVWVFSRRLSMSRKGEPLSNGGMLAFAWFVWEHGWKDSPRLGWIDTRDNIK